MKNQRVLIPYLFLNNGTMLEFKKRNASNKPFTKNNIRHEYVNAPTLNNISMNKHAIMDRIFIPSDNFYLLGVALNHRVNRDSGCF